MKPAQKQDAMGTHPIRNCANIAHGNQQRGPIQQLLHSPMDNNKTITLVNFYMVQMDNGSMETMDTWTTTLHRSQ
jgi:hypothetical protein